jgi:hypothetical protein
MRQDLGPEVARCVDVRQVSEGSREHEAITAVLPVIDGRDPCHICPGRVDLDRRGCRQGTENARVVIGYGGDQVAASQGAGLEGAGFQRVDPSPDPSPGRRRRRGDISGQPKLDVELVDDGWDALLPKMKRRS